MLNLLTVKQFAERHPAFSEASLRYHIFNEETNNLSVAIVRIGRKILIKENVFFDWVEAQQSNLSQINGCNHEQK